MQHLMFIRRKWVVVVGVYGRGMGRGMGGCSGCVCSLVVVRGVSSINCIRGV